MVTGDGPREQAAEILRKIDRLGPPRTVEVRGLGICGVYLMRGRAGNARATER